MLFISIWILVITVSSLLVCSWPCSWPCLCRVEKNYCDPLYYIDLSHLCYGTCRLFVQSVFYIHVSNDNYSLLACWNKNLKMLSKFILKENCPKQVLQTKHCWMLRKRMMIGFGAYNDAVSTCPALCEKCTSDGRRLQNDEEF